MKCTKQKGTRDIFFDDMKIWHFIEENIRKIADIYNLSEIRTPVFEATELYLRGVGDETDIVNKEMYTFLDKGGRSITLRPELTAGVVRAYIENGFSSMPSPVKLWYNANMYRYEKMQKGRYREFAQYGVEIFGSKSVYADLESIMISYNLISKLGLKDDVTLDINSIGCTKCRGEYINKLKEYIRPNLDSMCESCKTRYEKNPLRILDCKEDECKKILENAPMITDNLCEECNSDFEKLQSLLKSANIDYRIDKKIVRGLDYYNKTVYEYTSKDLGIAVGGGGRYDGLVEILGGASTPAVGFALGMDRLILLIKEKEEKIKNENIDIYFSLLDNSYLPNILNMVYLLRNSDVKVEFDLCDRSFKANLKYADKLNVKYTCIIGEDEIKNSKCILKNMKDSTQIDCNFELDEILKVINK